MAYITGYANGTQRTNQAAEGLMADFSGMKNLEKRVDSVLRRLAADSRTESYLKQVKQGTMSKAEFDVNFSVVVRQQLGKVLGILRNKAVEKAKAAGAGSASTAVLRRMYRSKTEGNINIAGHRGRISPRHRIVPPPTGGKSGIRRNRTVKDRTKQLREYYGPDRDFILRIFSEGRDEFFATGEGPTGRGSKATYGRRGAMAPRWNFVQSMQSEMQQAAEQLGIDLVKYVEKFLETQFTEE